MSKTIKPEQLSDEIMKGLEEYKDLSTDAMKESVEKVAKKVKKDIQSAACSCRTVSADPSSGTWSCQARRWESPGYSAYRSC